jgi:hypothetical protein
VRDFPTSPGCIYSVAQRAAEGLLVPFCPHVPPKFAIAVLLMPGNIQIGFDLQDSQEKTE